MQYIPTIGLEVHVELNTKTKMFCDSLNDPDEKHPNINVCPVCMGHPGTLPVINAEAIHKLMMVGLALNCSIEKNTFFERKNYFYPDLPKGYQISQYLKPLCYDGHLDIATSNKLQATKRIRIERIHLEEDAGRLAHEKDATLVDFNRAGLPLMELVTKPDLETAQDVIAFASELRLIMRYLGASDADMEKGQMRVEVNISVRPEGNVLGTKVEIKNINSISAAGKAVEFEIRRQSELLDAGKKIVQETRGWDDVNNKTVSQRIKEGSADYRYFPEPDLPPLSFDDAAIEAVRNELPELPSRRRKRFKKEYGLSEKDVEVFTLNKALGNYFEKVASELLAFDNLKHLERPAKEHEPKLLKLASNYIMTELSRMASEVSASPEETKIKPESFAELVVAIFHNAISSSAAQIVLKEMFETGLTADQIVQQKDLAQVSDIGVLGAIVERVITENSQAVRDYKKGKEASLKFLIGKVMAGSKGKANPQVVQEIIKNKLS
ncbi:MAG: Asp-tRNA(Asn)/Glu-tRNA(Gln) amidotransferase subunit GatB [Patescibacteria group bacterium]